MAAFWLWDNVDYLVAPEQWKRDRVERTLAGSHALNPMFDLGLAVRKAHPGKPVLFTQTTNGQPPPPTTTPHIAATVVPLTPDQGVHLETHGRVVINGNESDMTQCPFVNFAWKLHKNPAHIMYALWNVTRNVVGYVFFTYQDFYDQFKHWDANPTTLVWNAHFLWRAIVTGIVTVRLIQSGLLLMTLTEWFKILTSIIEGAFGLVGKALSDVLYFIEVAYHDIRSLLP